MECSEEYSKEYPPDLLDPFNCEPARWDRYLVEKIENATMDDAYSEEIKCEEAASDNYVVETTEDARLDI